MQFIGKAFGFFMSFAGLHDAASVKRLLVLGSTFAIALLRNKVPLLADVSDTQLEVVAGAAASYIVQSGVRSAAQDHKS